MFARVIAYRQEAMLVAPCDTQCHQKHNCQDYKIVAKGVATACRQLLASWQLGKQSTNHLRDATARGQQYEPSASRSACLRWKLDWVRAEMVCGLPRFFRQLTLEPVFQWTHPVVITLTPRGILGTGHCRHVM